MKFKDEIKVLLKRRKSRLRALKHTVRVSLAQRLIHLQEERRIQNILDALD